jgi:CxxC motif-containing protein (DUF1111 family)
MPRAESTLRFFRSWPVALSRIGSVIGAGVLAIGFARAVEDQPLHEVLARGEDLFAREWLPEHSKRAGGDGLGPVYNESSCVACHHQGGPGGGGPTSTNVDILSIGRLSKDQTAADFHPGLRTSRSVVLHRFGVDPEYKAWRLRLLGEEGLADMVESVATEIQQVQQLMIGPVADGFTSRESRPLANGMVVSQRNAPALFGAGRIDALPDGVLVAAEKRRFPEFPQIRGRANHLKDQRLGDIEGIYSDLLLHDMGPGLSDSGTAYGIRAPDASPDGVKSQEWRTPPLWGFRYSGPYLHDGRAENLEEAVALHGGQSTSSAKRFFKLSPEQRLRVQVFLRSPAERVAAARSVPSSPRK